MTPEERDEWADALESGNFKQGRGKLNQNDEEFCCLGVKCELDVRAGRYRIERRQDVGGNGAVKYGINHFTKGSPYREIYEDAWGIDDNDIVDLINDNDSGVSFAEIAKWIRANL